MVLVTGGTGLVGSHLIYHLMASGQRVKAIHRPHSDLEAVRRVFEFYSDTGSELFEAIEWVEADITDIYSLELAFEGVHQVYHAAALVSFDPKEYWNLRKINIDGTSNVVNLCIDHQIEKLCFVSSIATLEKQLNSAVIDESASQTIGDRASQSAAALAHLEAQIQRREDAELHVHRLSDGTDNAGTLMMQALRDEIAEIPAGRLAGVVAITDGQAHDLEMAPDPGVPFHL